MNSLGSLHVIGSAPGPYGLVRRHGHKLEPFFRVWFDEPETKHLPYDFLRISGNLIGYSTVPALSKVAKLWTAERMFGLVERVNATIRTRDAGINGTTRISQGDWQYVSELLAEMERMDTKKSSDVDMDSMAQMLIDARTSLRPNITVSRLCHEMQTSEIPHNYIMHLGVHGFSWQDDDMEIDRDILHINRHFPASTIDGLVGRDVATLIDHPAIPLKSYRILSAVQSSEGLSLHTDMHDDPNLLQCEQIDD